MNPILLSCPNLLQRLIWVPVRILFRVFLRWRIEGREHIETLPRGVLLSVNHTSGFDPVLAAGALPFLSRHLPLFYVSRSPDHYRHLGWRSMFYGGFLFKLWGSYSAESGTHDYERALAPHAELLTRGKTVCIFPNGRIERPGEAIRIHGGVTYLSWKTGQPIVPLHISGAEGLTLPKLLTGKRRVTVTFHKPIFPIELFDQFHGTPIVSETHNDFRSAAESLPY